MICSSVGPDEKPAVVPLKLFDRRLNLVSHDVDLPAGCDAQDARRARLIAGGSAGFGHVEIAHRVEGDAAGIVEEADNNFSAIAGKQRDFGGAGGGDGGGDVIEWDRLRLFFGCRTSE